MKKLVLTTLVMIGCGAAYALPIGNPSEASLYTDGVFFSSMCCNPCDPCFCWFDAWSLRMGFYGDYVYNRNLEIDGSGLGQGNTIDKTEIYTNAGYLVLNICDKIDFFGSLGASKIIVKTGEASWVSNGNAQGVLETDTKFSWSAGARATLFDWNCFSIGVEGQYFKTTPDLSQYVTFNGGNTTYFNENNETTYQEWQVGLGLSYSILTSCPDLGLIPYAGVKWAWAKWDTDDFTFLANGPREDFTIFDMEAKKLWGFAVGVTFTMYDMIGVTVEGRWADEQALYVNGQFRF